MRKKPLRRRSALLFSSLRFLYSRQLLAIFLLSFFSFSRLHAQGSLELARYLGGSGDETGVGSVTRGGFIYLWSATTSPDLPVVNGNAYHGGSDIYLAKLDNSGQLVFAGYFGGSDNETIQNTLGAVEGNDIYLVFSTYSNDLPATNGTVYAGAPGTSNLAVARVNSVNGAIVCCAYGGPFPSSFYGMKVAGGDIYLGAIVTMFDSPITTTNGSAYKGGFDIALARFDGSTGNRVWETYWGSPQDEFLYGLEADGNDLHILVYSNAGAAAIPSTDGSINHGGYDIIYAKLNAFNLGNSFLTFLGGSANDTPISMELEGGETYILGNTRSYNFPTTTGAAYKGNSDATVTKFRANGTIAYSTIVGGAGEDAWPGMSFAKRLDVDQGSVCFALRTVGSGYPVTNGSIGTGDDIAVTRLNASGQVVFSSYVGSPASDYSYDVKMQCDDIYVMASFGQGLPAMDGSLSSSAYNTGIVKFNAASGKMTFASYIGATTMELTSLDLSLVANGVIQAVTYVPSNALPAVTVPGNAYGGGGSDLAIVRINTSLAGFAGSTAVSPSSQNICANGTTSLLQMAPAVVPGSSLNAIYVLGVPSTQADVPAQRYQWQVANAPGGPWSDLPGANAKSFTPPTGAVTKYYRRLAYYTPPCSAEMLVQTGDVAAVTVNANNAPVVDAGGPFVTCAGTPVRLGGSPSASASAGSSIVSYLWSPAAAYVPGNTSANPEVSPATTTIYTLTVTDDKGCEQTGQALVNVYAANAGPAKNVCGGQSVRIGTAPIAGVNGVIYSWTASPADPSMSCTNCAQPDVHPSVTTSYTLTLTIPVSGGGSCTSSSSVTVSVVAAPVNNGGAFGGPDITVCSGGGSFLGTTAEAGFSYTWSPASYISAASIARPLFAPGSQLPPTDPVRFYVTAAKNGCSFVDSVEAYVLKADAGLDGCGPRLIGTADATPRINETYSWTKLTTGAGTSNFLGATNLPQVPVSSATVATTFRLTIMFNGVSCTDDVVVGACGNCVTPAITVHSPNTCASFGASGGQVTLTASSPIASTFSWSPAVGLSSTTGATVRLTDNIPRVYTVTATSTIDPSVVCTNTIEVNNPAWNAPVFTAQRPSVCPGTPVNIGELAVAGYSYSWSGNGLDANNISNPLATVTTSSRFPVVVTDNTTGCTTADTAVVTIYPMPQNLAGNDLSICGAGTVQLGSAPVPGVNYLWSPAAAYMPGNTSANPTVLVATTTTFHVDAYNAQGCTASGDITVTVNPPVAPFSFFDQSFCPSNVGEIALPAGPSGMDKYSWSPAVLVINPDSNGPDATTLATLPPAAHSYTLTVTNAAGCTGQATVNFIPATSVPDAGPNKIICLSDGPVQIGSASNPVNAGISYSWSPTTGLSDPTDPDPFFTPSAASQTTYVLTKDEGGCITQSAVTITVNEYVLPALGSISLCQNACAQVGISPQAGVSYSWSPAAGLSSASAANPMACPSSTTSYTLTAVGSNGCSASGTIIVSVAATVGPAVSVVPLTACLGSAGNILSANVSPSAGNYTYEWTPGNGSLSNVYAQSPYVYIGNLGTKNYSVKVTDQSNGCSTTAAAVVNVISCITLPVTIESFTAAPKEKMVMLAWIVSDEVKLARYEAEFSTDGRNFYKIGSVPAQGRPAYQLLHHDPVAGNNYYRLKMVDIGGAAHYSPVRLVVMNTTGNGMTVFPNPAREEAKLLLPSAFVGSAASIQIFDASGRLVISLRPGSLLAAQAVNISRLPAGLYAVVVCTAKTVLRSKFLVER